MEEAADAHLAFWVCHEVYSTAVSALLLATVEPRVHKRQTFTTIDQLENSTLWPNAHCIQRHLNKIYDTRTHINVHTHKHTVFTLTYPWKKQQTRILHSGYAMQCIPQQWQPSSAPPFIPPYTSSRFTSLPDSPVRALSSVSGATRLPYMEQYCV